jgi:EpsI family protein
MLKTTGRYLLVIGLLLAGVLLTWGQRWSADARLSEGPVLPTPSSPSEAEAAPQFIYFLDVEGWYRITPYETVVRSPYDFTAETTEGMAAALPAALGEWKQVGEDEYVGDDPDVVFYLKNPTVALQRQYQDGAGQTVTLAIIGNRGEDSFLLFSHTPETCYPGQLWQVVEKRQESTLLSPPPPGAEGQPMEAQYLLTEHGPSGRQLMVLYWYQWDDPRRDSEEGVLSVRVNLFIAEDQTPEQALERAWDFVRELFPEAIPWDRF